MNKWIAAFRLRTLPLSFSCIITGSALAFYYHKFNWIIFLLCIVTTLFLQILSNLANDFGDAVKGTDNNERVGPERAIQSGAISIKQMKKAIILFVILSLFSGVPLVVIATKNISVIWLITFLAIGILAIIAAIKYTTGKSAYGYKGLGDFFVFIFFGWVGVLGTLFLHQQSISWIDFLPANTIGLLSVAVLNLNNMRDIRNDENFGKKTIPVKIGINYAKSYHFILIVLAVTNILFYTLSEFSEWKNYLFIISFFPLIKHLNKIPTIKDDKKFDPELKKVALSTFLFSILFFLGILL